MNIKKGTFYVFVANAINLVITLFSGFVLPKLLSIDCYSNIKLFQLYITYVGILHLGYSDGMYIRLGGKEINSLDSKEILSEFKTFKLFQLIVTIVLVIVCLIIKNEILLFCSLVILPVNVGSYLKSLYQATGKFETYSKFLNINTIFIFLINMFLVLIVKTDNYIIYIVGQIIAYIIYWIYIEIETRKIISKEKVKINFKYMKENIKSGFFFMIGNFCNVIFTSIDRLFVQNVLGSTKFAYYSFAVSIENLLNVFVTPISTVMYNYLCNNNKIEDVIRLKRKIIIFSAFIVAIVFPINFFIRIWIDKYIPSIEILSLLFASQYVSIIIRTIHTNLFKAKRQQTKYFIVMLGTVIISIILNVIGYLIYNDNISFAIATLLTNIIWFILGEVLMKEFKLKIKDYLYSIIVLGLYLICCFVFNDIFGCIVYIGVLVVITVLIEKKELIELIKQIFEIVQEKLNKFRRK